MPVEIYLCKNRDKHPAHWIAAQGRDAWIAAQGRNDWIAAQGRREVISRSTLIVELNRKGP